MNTIIQKKKRFAAKKELTNILDQLVINSIFFYN